MSLSAAPTRKPVLSAALASPKASAARIAHVHLKRIMVMESFPYRGDL